MLQNLQGMAYYIHHHTNQQKFTCTISRKIIEDENNFSKAFGIYPNHAAGKLQVQ